MEKTMTDAITTDFEEKFKGIKGEYKRMLTLAEIADPLKRHIWVNAARAQVYRCKLLFEDFGFDSSKENILKALQQ